MKSARRKNNLKIKEIKGVPYIFQKVVVLKDGDIFGELALINQKKRAATITCETECHFAILSRSDF